MGDSTLRARLPHGLSDVFLEQAALKDRLENAVTNVFSKWGYGRIYVPTFEFYDSLTTEASARTRSEMYRFFDRAGNVMALRPDMTVAAARLAGTKLYDQPLPLRLFYTGNVFRHVAPQAGRQHEFTQAGIELIGASTPKADAEVISITVAALTTMGLADFQINLGQVAFLKGLLQDHQLDAATLASLEDAIERKNPVELEQLLQSLDLSKTLNDAIRTIPSLCGRGDILDTARKLAVTPASRIAVERLAEVYGLLQSAGVGDHIILDLSEARSMGYYTGVTYHGYAAGLGFPICSGGRYDNLVAHFGRDMPAMGFALGIERAMLLVQEQQPTALDVLIASENSPESPELVCRMREIGLVVEQEITGRTGAELIAYAKDRNATRTITRKDSDHYIVNMDGRDQEFTLPALLEEVATWIRS